MVSLLAVAVAAHVGGIPTQAAIASPGDVGQIADGTFTIRWSDNEADPTGQLNFYFQAPNVAPGTVTGDADLMGTTIAGAQMVPISDTTNLFAWDTSGVAGGSYFVYAVTVDPPFGDIYGISDGPVTIQHGGDPEWPAVKVDEPDGIADTVTDAFAVKWHAAGAGALVATVRYRVGGSDHKDDPLELLSPRERDVLARAQPIACCPVGRCVRTEDSDATLLHNLQPPRGSGGELAIGNFVRRVERGVGGGRDTGDPDVAEDDSAAVDRDAELDEPCVDRG